MVYLLIPETKGNIDCIFYSISLFLKEKGIEHELLEIAIQSFQDFSWFRDAVVYLRVAEIRLLSSLRNFISRLKEMNAMVMIGGHCSISMEAEHILRHFPEIDIIIREPASEFALLETLIALKNGDFPGTVQGISCRISFGPGGIIQTPVIFHSRRKRLPDNIDHLKSPFIDIEKNRRRMPVILSAGCHHNCQYCVAQIPYKNDLENPADFWRCKNVIQAVNEIQAFSEQGITKLIFYNNEFLGVAQESKIFAEALLDEIIMRKLKIDFRFTAKPGNIRANFSLFPKLQEAGLSVVQIGIDSGLDRFHEMYQTGSSVNDCIAVLDFFHQRGLVFEVDFIFFDPFLTLTELEENLRFLKRIYPFFSHLSTPFCAVLDANVFISSLVLRHGMPVIRELEKHDLLIEAGEFPAHPAYRFMHHDTAIFYSAFSYINKLVLPRFRNLFYQSQLVGAVGEELALFPIIMMENLLTLVKGFTGDELDAIVGEMEQFSRERIKNIERRHSEVFSEFKTEKLVEWLNS